MNSNNRMIGIGLGMLCWLACPVLAQQPPSSVTGQGISTIEKRPQTLRLHLEVQAQAKSLKEALAALKQRREKAAARFVEWGAVKENIDLGTPKIVPGANEQQRMEIMVRARLNNNPSATQKPAVPLKVSATLKAEWKLEGLDPEAVLLKTQEIKEQIESADVAGVKADAGATPEQAEEMEENQQSTRYFDPSEQKPGEPIFLYVSRIAPEEMSKALTDAFEQARKDAGQLAAAAKVKLGKILTLSQNSSPDYSQSSYMENTYMMAFRYMQQAQMGQRLGSEEALGPDPSKVTHRVTVSASFGVE